MSVDSAFFKTINGDFARAAWKRVSGETRLAARGLPAEESFEDGVKATYTLAVAALSGLGIVLAAQSPVAGATWFTGVVAVYPLLLNLRASYRIGQLETLSQGPKS